MQSWIVSSPGRLDAFLADEDRMPSRAQARKAIEAGLVRVNDVKIRHVSERLQEGDQVTLTADLPVADTDIKPVDLKLTLLFEDDACFVINKPAGISVHPGAGMAPNETTILHGAAFLYQKRSLPFSAEGVLVHRLDKETTGCLLIAKSPAHHAALQKQFEERSVEKKYLAIVAGIPLHEKALVDSPIGRSTTDRTKMAVHRAGAARDAQTGYEILATGEQSALLLCTLHTGRTHQIRVHLSTLGHPVLGDGTYSNELGERVRDEHDIRSLCLHAWTLAFTSPADGKRISLTAPVPPEFRQNLEHCGISWKA